MRPYKYAPMWAADFDTRAEPLIPGRIVNATRYPNLKQCPQSEAVTLGTFVTPDHLCPDLLRYEQIGAADNWRGRVVRGFFWLMQVWRVP